MPNATETTCPNHCRFSDSYPVLNEPANERYPIRIDVTYGVQDFIDEAMWRTARIKDRVIDQTERMRREGELSEEQVTYQELFESDIEDFHVVDDVITFHFGYERRCGYITNEGSKVYNAGTEQEHTVSYRDRCGTKEQSHTRDHGHDFIPYPTPPPNEG